MQFKKSQPENKRPMSETKVTDFSLLSVVLRIGISRFASETDVYGSPNDTLLISMLFHNSEFRILNSEF